MEKHYNEEILKLSLDMKPHVLVDRYLPNITNSSVTLENFQGTLKACSPASRTPPWAKWAGGCRRTWSSL